MTVRVCGGAFRNILCGAALFLLGQTIMTPAFGQNSRLVHAIVVRVGGQPITKSQIEDTAKYLLRRKHGDIPARLTEREEAEVIEQARRELIKILLIEGAAEEEGIRPPLDRVHAQLKGMGLDPREVDDETRRFARTEVLFDELQNKAGVPPPTVTPGEMMAFWREHKDDVFTEKRFVKVRHIYMGTVIDKPATVEKKMELLRKSIAAKTGDGRTEFFSEIAKEYSQDRFKDIGGLLRLSPDPEGWFIQDIPNKRKDDKPLFPQAMYRALQGLTSKGQLSRVVRSSEGFHLLYLEDVKGGRQANFRDPRTQRLIESYLRQKERQKRLFEWLGNRFDQVRVVWHNGDSYPKEDIIPSSDDAEDAPRRQ